MMLKNWKTNCYRTKASLLVFKSLFSRFFRNEKAVNIELLFNDTDQWIHVVTGNIKVHFSSYFMIFFYKYFRQIVIRMCKGLIRASLCIYFILYFFLFIFLFRKYALWIVLDSYQGHNNKSLLEEKTKKHFNICVF